jgi:hypothetical protein
LFSHNSHTNNEQALLQLLLGMMEGQSPQVVRHLAAQTDMPILIQNMQCELRRRRGDGNSSISSSKNSSLAHAFTSSSSSSSSSSSDGRGRAKVVLYLTLATSLAEASADRGYQARARRLLQGFEAQRTGRRGRGTDYLIASIEIMGADKEADPQQVYVLSTYGVYYMHKELLQHVVCDTKSACVLLGKVLRYA